MFLIHGNDIYISRGDSATLDVGIYVEQIPYQMEPGDTISFEVFARPCGRRAKRIDTSDTTIVIGEDFTQRLKGRYDFCVTLNYADGTKQTLIGAAPNYTPHLYVLEG